MSERLTGEELAEIRARAEAATRPPWVLTLAPGHTVRVDLCGAFPICWLHGPEPCVNYESHLRNGGFITHAREDVPRLLDEVERLRAENERLREVGRLLADWYADPRGEVVLDYTNYKGERAARRVSPVGGIYFVLRFGTAPWHPEPQWLLEAWDDGKMAGRTFAVSGIHSWRIERRDIFYGRQREGS